MDKENILLSHGSGGRMMHELIRGMLLEKLGNPVLNELADAAFIPANAWRRGLAFTTDSFVVSPLKFSGGDIGKLAVCGTLNDLVMLGAIPEYLSLALIIEEGLSRRLLKEVVGSLSLAARKAGVAFATGDLKVVEKGACDKLFINTSGIGRIISPVRLSPKNIKPGDKVIITGSIAEHGLAVLSGRKELDLGFTIKSDCAYLNKLLLPLLKKGLGVKFMRDPTRGGLATTLNEAAEAAGRGIFIDEKKVPVSSKVRVACEMLGMDPLYIANEGKAVIIAAAVQAPKVLAVLRRHPLGRQAEEIGEVLAGPAGRVTLKTLSGSSRLLDMLTADPLPRIC